MSFRLLLIQRIYNSNESFFQSLFSNNFLDKCSNNAWPYKIWHSLQQMMEEENNAQLAFLGLLITRISNGFKIFVYHKTFIGKYLIFDSYNVYSDDDSTVQKSQVVTKTHTNKMIKCFESKLSEKQLLCRNNISLSRQKQKHQRGEPTNRKGRIPLP